MAIRKGNVFDIISWDVDEIIINFKSPYVDFEKEVTLNFIAEQDNNEKLECFTKFLVEDNSFILDCAYETSDAFLMFHAKEVVKRKV